MIKGKNVQEGCKTQDDRGNYKTEESRELEEVIVEEQH